MVDQDPQGPNDLVKVTIRLPRYLVQLAKIHAMGLGDDLQDVVRRALTEDLRGKPIPTTHLLSGASKEQRERVRTVLRDVAAKNLKRAASYGARIKTKGKR